jgi:hypothetical protein
MTTIARRDLATTTIADTGITVADLIRTFLRTQDGRIDREMEDEHGHELGQTVVETRAALRDLVAL